MSDVLNIDSQCKVPHCSVLVLSVVLLVLAAGIVVVCLFVRKCLRERARVESTQITFEAQIQAFIQTKTENQANTILRTEANLKQPPTNPKLELLEALNLEVSGAELYHFEEDR